MSKLLYDAVLDAELPKSVLELNEKIPDESFFSNRLDKQTYAKNYTCACKANESIIEKHQYDSKDLLMMREQWLTNFIAAGRAKYDEVSRIYPFVAIAFSMFALTLNRNAWGFLFLSVVLTLWINIRSVFSSRNVAKFSPRAILLLSILDSAIVYRQDINEVDKSFKMENLIFTYRRYQTRDKKFISRRVDKLFLNDITKPFNHLLHLNTYIETSMGVSLIRHNHILLSKNMKTITNMYAKHLYVNNIDPDDITHELEHVNHVNDIIKASLKNVIPGLTFMFIYEWAIFLINFKPNTFNALIFVTLNVLLTILVTSIIHKPVNLTKSNNYTLINIIHNSYKERRHPKNETSNES